MKRPSVSDEVWRHIKRGSLYRVLGDAELQSAKPLEEGAILVVYRDAISGRLWARPASEFHDGRFEVVEPDAASDLAS